MTWASKYVGIPFRPLSRSFKGCDCYGIGCLVYRHELGIELPSYTDDYAEALDKDEIAALIAREQADWKRVVPALDLRLRGDDESGGVRAFDVVLLRAQGVAWHVGVVVEPGVMLHVLKGIDSCIERYDGLHWKHRVVGFYRYVTPL